ncbi:ribonuclease Z [Proteiniphilum sp. UBA1028]|jgi:ribonuclease Z|uniref:ribonuclease Z n=1 Tax=Proteiniphilum sp. UBA1028 TaxID=1947251 RepID=UPI0025EA1243|nr:ribonuclease Z [Proteiniphilum sp. UBA1028]
MTKFQVTILGCGSAMPTTLHNPPSQLVDMNEKLFMIDCGEGTQLQMRKFKTRMSKLHSLFISHLHGDHTFGLPGLLSTLSMLGRTGDLNIYAHKEIDFLLNPLLTYLGNHMSFNINIFPLNPDRQEVLLENRSIKVTSFPLRHRIPSNGFLFEEKETPRHINREMIDFYHVPVKQIPDIKKGADFLTPDGSLILNRHLTYPGNPARRYAYCSDTAYAPEIVQYIEKVDLLYHEATFAESEIARAKETYHSTARQAAEIAREAGVKKLVIGHYSSRYSEIGTLLKEAVAVFPDTELAVEGKILSL